MVQFPIFAIHTADVDTIDGITWIEDQVLDDKNMSGETLGLRRLQTPMKSIYPLKIMLEDEVALMKHHGKHYIDNYGKVFTYVKTRKVKLIYLKIARVVQKDICSIVWVKDVPFPFEEKRPLPSEAKWAGVLYKSGIPWKIYEYTTEKKKDTYRKC